MTYNILVRIAARARLGEIVSSNDVKESQTIMATKEFSLPARGSFPDLNLAKKAPKETDVVLVGVFAGEQEGDIELPASAPLNAKALRAAFASLAAVGAKTRVGAITRVPAHDGSGAVVAVGLGNPEEFDEETLRRAAGAAARAVESDEHVVTSLHDLGVGPVVEGLILGGYKYEGLRSAPSDASEDTREPQPVKITLIGGDKETKAEFVAAQVTAESVVFTRDLVNTPSSHLFPESYAAVLTREAQQHGVDVEVLDEKALDKQGFGGILAVGGGSSRLPRLVRMTWAGGKKKSPKVGLVGKGITFDTGGISLKPASKMENMISDMGGSAAMAGVIVAAARLNLPLHITATLPLAENMPSGTAIRPGDVITHYGGTTSEVLNTDAEGRLVLADALARASEDAPEYLVDTATLTGAQMVALGAKTAGVMGTDQLRDHLAAIGREVGENAWAMPLLEEHDEDLKSPVADIRNHSNSRNGGMLFAATYLRQFVGDDIAWAHIDIAGPSFNDGGVDGYTVKRATGVPVRTLVSWLRGLAEKK